MNWPLLIIGMVLTIILGMLFLLAYKVIKVFKDLEKKYPYLFDKSTKNKSKITKR